MVSLLLLLCCVACGVFPASIYSGMHNHIICICWAFLHCVLQLEAVWCVVSSLPPYIVECTSSASQSWVTLQKWPRGLPSQNRHVALVRKTSQKKIIQYTCPDISNSWPTAETVDSVRKIIVSNHSLERLPRTELSIFYLIQYTRPSWKPTFNHINSWPCPSNGFCVQCHCKQ